jgi:WD40 repeat protein
VRICDAVSGTIQHTLDDHKSPVTFVAFSSDGLQIRSGSEDTSIHIWNTNMGQLQCEHNSHRYFRPLLAQSGLNNGWLTLSM